ncbi:MAG TPA: M20/M25/M40 family metallo-hydrolase [Acidimicrobiia bacterium]
MEPELTSRITSSIDRDRLVATASDLVAISSPTGTELEAARYLADVMNGLGLEVTLQHIEEGRANAVGRLGSAGTGPSLMFNGHLDTSYSGDEEWLQGAGFRPEPQVRDGAIFGLGIMNMKGAVACYVEAVRALLDAGVRLTGDLVIAGVAGEIEKAQWWPEFVGSEYRGYGSGTRHLVVHGGVTDAAILGEPTEERLVLGHWGTLWARISTGGPFFHTAYSTGRQAENSIVRMHDVVERVRPWLTEWEEQTSYNGIRGAANIGAITGGFPWRLSRTPHQTSLFLDLRVPPTMTMLEADRSFRGLLRSLQEDLAGHEISGEVFVTAPGSEIDEQHPLVAAVSAGHEAVHGSPPETDFVRWGSDAGILSRYGVASLNYGPISSALPGPEGEQVPIESLINTAGSYALAAIEYCGVAT